MSDDAAVVVVGVNERRISVAPNGAFVVFLRGETRGRSCPGFYSVAAKRLKTLAGLRPIAVVGALAVAAAVLHQSPFCRACGPPVLSRSAAAERSLGRPPPQDRTRKNTTQNPIGVTENQFGRRRIYIIPIALLQERERHLACFKSDLDEG